jgi:molybdenum cofactor synthesis domain-containing protein
LTGGSIALPPGATFREETLREPGEAIAAYLRCVEIAPPGLQFVALGAAAGRVLAQAIVSPRAHPARARATVDGFAIRAAGPGVRRVAGEWGADPLSRCSLGAGEALRVATRGVLPAGADAVVALEDAEPSGDEIRVPPGLRAGDGVTAAGADIAWGETLLEAGRRIGAAELAVLATLGTIDVPVCRRPLVAVISTGDEPVDCADSPHGARVRDPKRDAVGAILASLGCRPVHVAGGPRDEASLGQAIRGALAAADAVVVIGGTSVGERDVTARAIDALGAPGVVVHGLRVKPGKPTVLGAVAGKPVIGLPGNPASALMIAEAVVAPVFTRLAGAAPCPQALYEAVAACDFIGRDGWTWFVPARLEVTPAGLFASPLPLRSAHASLLARAHGYVILPETRARVSAGRPVSVRPFASGMRALA